MKILVVDQYYYPEQFQINDICERMVKDGHSVTVLTGLPNYPTGIIPDEYKRGRKRKEKINGVGVIRCPELGRSKGAIGMAKNYLSYALSASIKQFFLRKEYDLVFIYETSPVTLAYPGELFARRKKLPVFFYCCDIWPECVKVMIKNEKSLPYRIIKKMSTKIYRRADIVALQSEGFFDYFEKIHGINRRRLRYLPQFADSNYLTKDFTPEDNGVIDFVFTGNVGIAQDIGGIINAVDRIRNRTGFRVHIVGDGSFLDTAKKMVDEKQLNDKIVFYGRRPYEEMASFYKLADVCMATLQSNSLLNLTMPSKVQGYMAAGKPILAAVTGKSREILEENRCGICVEPGNVDELSKAMVEFIDHYEKYRNFGENGRKYFIENFTMDIFMNRLYEQFEETIKEHRR